MAIIAKEMLNSVLTLRIDGVKHDWRQKILLISDPHVDSIFCEKKKLKDDLDEAKEENAWIFFAGDVFDAMQGKRDPRANYDDLSGDLKVSNYFDALVSKVKNFFTPYANNIMLIGKGNHESSVLRHHNISLIDRLVYSLNMETKSDVSVGNFGGWIKIVFIEGSNRYKGVNIKYNHGFGTESPQSKGVLQSSRQAQYLPDAQIVWTGHNHNQYILPIGRERISERGVVYQDTQVHVRTPGYKNDYDDGSCGFPVENGHTPKPVGGIWIELVPNHESSSMDLNFTAKIR